MLKEREGGGCPISFMCSRVRLIHWVMICFESKRRGDPISFLCRRVRLIHRMMTCVESKRRRRGSDIFYVSSSYVNTQDDDMCRK